MLAVIKSPEFGKRIGLGGSEALGSSPEAFAVRIASETAKLAKEGKIQVERQAAPNRYGTLSMPPVTDLSSILPTSSMRSIFHIAYNVRDLTQARRFYGDLLGCTEGRSTETWVDFNFYGHQLSLHLGEPFATARTGHVGDVLVPMPHFGLVLELADWRSMAQRLETAGIDFVLSPQVRFEGQTGEQWTMFFLDPFGNPIEVKGFLSLDGLYEKT